MTPSARITAQLQTQGPTWASTDECAGLLLDAQADPADHRRALETLEAYGRRSEAEAAARAIRASRTEQALHDLPQALERWAAAHPERFAPSPLGEPRPGGWWGAWDDTRGCLWLRCDIWRDLVQGWGLGPVIAVRELERRGFLLRHKQAHRRRQAMKQLGARQRWCYPLRLSRMPLSAETATASDRDKSARAAELPRVAWFSAVVPFVILPPDAQ